MSISITSLLETVLFSNTLIVLICLIIVNQRKKYRLNPQNILFCIVFVIIRCFFPCEFFYTITLKSKKVLPLFIDVLQYEFQYFNITVKEMVLFLWIGIALLKLIKLILNQYKAESIIQKFSVSKNQCLLKELLSEKNIKKNIHLIEIPEITSPALIGLRNTKIIIPTGISEQELYFILLHELEHYQKGDLYFLTVLHLICVVYWWNPLIYLLKSNAQKIMEYRIDNNVIGKLDNEGKVSYLQSIMKVVQLRNPKKIEMPLGIGFYEKQSSLVSRFMMISNNKYKKNDYQLSKVILALMLLSTVFIYEPYYIKEEYEKNTFSVAENSYLVRNQGKYDLYIDGLYRFTIDRTDGFEGLVIYMEGEK